MPAVVICWKSIEAHEKNFRQSSKWQEFRDLIGDFFAEPTVTEHFKPID